MPTQISCGATDCEFNAGKNSPGALGNENPQCTSDVIRIAPGKMGAAVCFNYTNAPLGQRQMMAEAGIGSQPPMAGNIDKPLY